MLKAKKAIPAIQVFRHRELARKIASLKEDIAELKSEKALLLNQFNCADDRGMLEVKQHIASMESSLEKLSQQEGKYTAELDAALKQYTELQQQAVAMDARELDAARRALRIDKDRQTVQQLQTVYRNKFDSSLLAQSRKDTTEELEEVWGKESIFQQIFETKGQSEHQKSSHKEIDR